MDGHGLLCKGSTESQLTCWLVWRGFPGANSMDRRFTGAHCSLSSHICPIHVCSWPWLRHWAYYSCLSLPGVSELLQNQPVRASPACVCMIMLAGTSEYMTVGRLVYSPPDWMNSTVPKGSSVAAIQGPVGWRERAWRGVSQNKVPQGDPACKV